MGRFPYIFGLLVLLQVVYSAPNEKIEIVLEDKNVQFELEEEEATLNTTLAGEGPEGGAISEEEEQVPTAFYLKEVREQLEGRQDEQQHSRVAKRHTTGAVYSGHTIALQTHIRNLWVSCVNHDCNRLSCPGLYFDSSEHAPCAGESFNIYRARGSGAIRVGDLVGLYYGGGQWMGCYDGTCRKYSCPGYPTLAYGFSNDERWILCAGEAFKIYAYGKNVGDTITNRDDIMLFYLQGQDWVSHYDGTLNRLPCPGQSRPPPRSRYDGCVYEVFQIWD